MADIVDHKTRSRMMSGIKGKNTKPEIYIRKLLHKHGFRFRIHVASLTGKPDMVLKRYKAVIFVHGCFWHAHHCHLFKQPSTRPEFWQTKIAGNRERDAVNIKALNDSGWRVLTIWECSLKGKTRIEETELLERITTWISGDAPEYEIMGHE
ncbi:very short patch repair endonuclease [Mariprofundus ferrooxydans]|uniref:very short patch repair endonuclease n=1 Tax=Mariprofundus ferrooxydans TaxID=314344 RepID=UPI0014306F4A|nr:DNA mismatch endonuclease Vsr [Mariprofundus ferrooxydans]